MTLILRRTCAPAWCHLGAAGLCRVGLAEVVGCWGSGPVKRILFLGACRGHEDQKAA